MNVDFSDKLRGLDLFSGIGGISLALSPWVRPVAYCENDRYAQAVLLSRMQSNELHPAPIWDDVRTLRGEDLPAVDIIYGGSPCQDISVAGVGRGLAGERSGLFLHIARLAEEIRPPFIFLENVPAIRTRGLGVVTFELARLGYDMRWTIISAQEIGAPHLRRRWFLLAAHADGIKQWKQQGRGEQQDREAAPISGANGEKELLADAYGMREQQCAQKRDEPRHGLGDGGEKLADALRSLGCAGRAEQEIWRRIPYAFQRGDEWPAGIPEPSLRGGSHGLSYRIHRLRALGNSVVPAQAREAFIRLAGLCYKDRRPGK